MGKIAARLTWRKDKSNISMRATWRLFANGEQLAVIYPEGLGWNWHTTGAGFSPHTGGYPASDLAALKKGVVAVCRSLLARRSNRAASDAMG